jgi:hypothetical protein
MLDIDDLFEVLRGQAHRRTPHLTGPERPFLERYGPPAFLGILE